MFHRFCLLLLAVLVLVNPTPAVAAGHPVVAGFERFYDNDKADLAQGGSLLLTELNCVACHQQAEANAVRKQAPVLDQVASRVRLDHLRRYLADPHAVKPGSTMPNLLADDPDRDAKVEALVHFLAQTGTVKQQRPDARAAAMGKELYSRVGCVACHGPRDAKGLAETTVSASAVPLGDLKTKYSIPSLAAFLENPHQARPSGRMPKILKGEESRFVANYLLQGIKTNVPDSPGSSRYAYYEGEWENLPDFTKLKPLATGTGGAFDLGSAKQANNYALVFDGFFRAEVAGTYQFWLISDDGSRLLVDGKKVVDNDGIHAPTIANGKVRLTRGIHKVQVQFFQGGGGAELSAEVEGPGGLSRQPLAPLVGDSEASLNKKPTVVKDDLDTLEVVPALAAKGQALFASLGCASCHALQTPSGPTASTLKAPALDQLKATGGCLAEKPARGLPIYDLSARQRQALTATLKTPVAPPKEPAAVIARTMATFNCYACHVRDKVGGITEDLNRYFLTSQPEMGEEGRVPPPLDNVGAKLNLDYFKSILDQGSRDRPYMQTHMPGFGLANVAAFVSATTATDKLDPATPVTMTHPTARVKAAGRFMVSGKALGCIKCHTFHGIKAEGVQGIDMTLMTKRVQHDWFQAYLLDPQRIRPGTRMPQSWPQGNSFYPDILDGKAFTQIEALWVYLKDGNSAQIPAGLGPQSIPLVPGKEAIIYRNFIEGAGSRAIGVGYPEKVNLAFDANELRLALIWQGAFIDAARHWTDRGSGYEGPLGDNILHLAAGPTFAVLDSPSAAWPKGQARDHGWKFGGYRLSADERPTFFYSLDDVKVEDFPNPTGGKDFALKRTLQLSAPKAKENLTLRAAVGAKIEALDKGWFRVDGWKLKIEGGTPTIREVGGTKELLVPVEFKDGKAELVLEYVW